eukprot:TRINITY_DN9908_c0_g1_i1.p2 TRINITY_DN9908_c0_g1~~TRINITY_DN9908_c0_g1_i1.p2  ORF type:complete len:147 (-),score=18.81 TRINITY_DN9908_c0_g1_i1:144-584(-)
MMIKRSNIGYCWHEDVFMWKDLTSFFRLAKSSIWEVYLLGLFALANLSNRKENRDLMLNTREDEVNDVPTMDITTSAVDCILCEIWCPSRLERPLLYANMIRKNFRGYLPQLQSVVLYSLTNHHQKFLTRKLERTRFKKDIKLFAA